MTRASPSLRTPSAPKPLTQKPTPLGLRRAAVSSCCCYEVINQNCARRPEGKQKQTMDLCVGAPGDESLSRKAP